MKPLGPWADIFRHRFRLAAQREAQEAVAFLQEADLRAWLDQGLQLRSDSGVCRLAPAPLMASERADGFYLSAESRIDCPGANTDGNTDGNANRDANTASERDRL